MNRWNARAGDRETDIGIAVAVGVDQHRGATARRLNRDIASSELLANHLDDIAIADIIDRIAVKLGGGAAERIVAAAALKRILAATASDEVITGAALDQIIASAALDRIVAEPPIDRIVAGAAVDNFRTAATGQEIIAAIAAETQADIGAVDSVVTRGGDVDLIGCRQQLIVGDDRAVAGKLKLLNPGVVEQPVLHPDEVVELEEVPLAVLPKTEIEVITDQPERCVGKGVILQLDTVIAAVDLFRRVDMSKRALRNVNVVVVDQILAVAGRIDIIVVTAAALDRVVAGAAPHGVGTGILIQLLGAGWSSAEKEVVAGATIQGVVVITAKNRIVAVAAVDPILAVTAKQRVRAAAAGKLIIAKLAFEPVIAGAAGQGIDSIAAQNGVVPGAADDRVITRRSIGDHVETVGIGDRVISSATRYVGQHIGGVHHRAVGEVQFLDRIEAVLPIRDGDQIGQAVKVGVAIANTDDHVITVEGDPKVTRRDASAKLQNVLAARIQFDGVVNRPHGGLAGEEILVIDDVDAVTKVEMINVVAAAAAQKVVAGAAGQSVGVGVFVEIVSAATAEQCVVTGAAKQQIRAGSTIDHIIAD